LCFFVVFVVQTKEFYFMQFRHVGKAGVQVSEVGLGSWQTYGHAVEAAQAEACINRAYELGINFFDTADAYAGGEAEKVVGKALAKFPRDSYVLSTKIYFPMGPGPNNRGLSRKHLFEGCHAALKRLGTDYIDLYQCHRYDEGTPLEETLRALNDLAQQGKILYYGISEWTGDQIAQAATIVRDHNFQPLTVNQPQYSMLARGIERDVIPVCEREGIGQVVFSPLAQGVLTGKYKPGQPLPEGSRAADPRQNQFFKTGVLDAYVHDRIAADDALLERVQKLVPIAQEAGLSLSQLALAWCLRQTNVSSVIIGASRPDQIDQNVAASGKTLSADVLTRIDRALAFATAPSAA
jgi:voltage-dependent potassium channel beta subunit